MLDGILGRGFSVKCKSLINTTRTRIGVVRRRAEAKQRFLKEDLSKLLSNGLDINAYGRTEEFIAGMNLLSCYDFVEKSCEYIVKQLSRMQKQSECPEECREAVASLMFAAARFSDLPELRDLRDAFQQRYGKGLQVFVNQKLVEKLSTRPPAAENRLQALQDIASEFAIKWDSRAFQRRMAIPPVVAQAEVNKPNMEKQRSSPDEKIKVPIYGEVDSQAEVNKPNMEKQRSFPDEKIKVPIYGEVDTRRRDEVENREPLSLRRGGCSSRVENNHSYPIENGEREIKIDKYSSSSHKKPRDIDHTRYTRLTDGLRDHKESPQLPPTYLKPAAKYEKVDSCYRRSNQDNVLKSIRIEDEDPAWSKSLPPPYVRYKDDNDNVRTPYVKPDPDEHIVDPGSCRTSHADNRSRTEPSHFEHFIAPGKVKRYGREKDIEYYQEENIPLPKPRCRRKHRKSSSCSRKDRSRRGLQTLIYDKSFREDEEERMIDELLLHYSKKPSSYDVEWENVARQPSNLDGGESSIKGGKFVPPSRLMSLPPEQTDASPEPLKVFNRANSFQPDNQARHVHPKLPDYDDLAARFAALRGG